ncbi:MAG TPA: hypothetical protein VGJ86_07645 [Acidimicrobiales bacterium]|jgi:DNA repair photolyase
MTDIRWELAEQPKAQTTLFEEPVFEREPGRGEFRGVEFLHVRAHRIINDVGSAPFGFRYTINAYRGCTHACSYCLVGETPILMADGRTKALADIRPGDTVYGTALRGGHRRYVPTPVLDHWSTTKAAYRVSLEDGTRLVASGDHRFLTGQGWKYVTGAGRRPHLTGNDSLLGIGAFATPPKAGPDYRQGYLRGVGAGDSSLVDLEARHRMQDYLDEGDIASGDPTPDWDKGFLAGIFDAQGIYSHGILRIPHGNDDVTSSLDSLGFRYVVDSSEVRLNGGLREHVRFFQTVDPAVTPRRTIDGQAVTGGSHLGVVAVDPLGMNLPMYDITTGTGDFIADGVVSHNCFARPSHTYLGLDADRDFERRIVVKVNAVSLLQRELNARRWQGDLIAMGTNTDPYQRCEGKYRLTRGIVEVLAEHANPFSILTKSTLILRDLPLLVEAARRTDVRVNFSIGTLDEEVWRTTEPGTPHPLRRIRAVETLNAAGVPCGVLVAPVLPDLSDRPEQLEAVVRACVAAGARSISAVALHLRPGVREVFFSRLAEHHPELVDSYQRRYRNRTYAPPPDRRKIEVLVSDLVRQHSTSRSRPDPPIEQVVEAPRRPTIEVTQLELL